MSLLALLDDSLSGFTVPGPDDNRAAKRDKIFDSFCSNTRVASSDNSILASQIDRLLMVLSSSVMSLDEE